MRKLRLILFALLLAPLACFDAFSSRDELELIVLESLQPCVGVAPMMCMRVIELPDTAPQLFYEGIEGFEFEAGVRQRIRVWRLRRRNPPADASIYEYHLIQLISQQRIYVPAYPTISTSAQIDD